MAYQRKTRDIFILMTNYGYGWEEEVAEYSYKEIRERAKEYMENTNAKIKVVRRREPISE